MSDFVVVPEVGWATYLFLACWAIWSAVAVIYFVLGAF